MGRHKLAYKLKKPNKHHKYWRYTLSNDPKGRYVSARTKVKYEADRIAREAYDRSLLSMKERCPTLIEYSANFFILGKCKISQRKAKAGKEYAEDMLKVKRGHLLNYLLPEFGMTKLFTITLKDFEDWRNKLDLSNSTKNGITSTFNVILKEALRDEYLEKHPLENVERLSKQAEHSRDILTLKEFKTLFPLDIEDGIKIWREQKYFTLLFLEMMIIFSMVRKLAAQLIEELFLQISGRLWIWSK